VLKPMSSKVIIVERAISQRCRVRVPARARRDQRESQRILSKRRESSAVPASQGMFECLPSSPILLVDHRISIAAAE
jgi:hypothetical protein